VGRFDRQHTQTPDLPAILETAAEEFRASIEREVRTVIETAQSRAAEIERQAEFNASQREQLSEHRAQQIVDTVFSRATRVLDSIDLVESALSGMLDALRAELQSLAPHEQDEALTPGSQADEPQSSVEQETARPEEPQRFLTPAAEQEGEPEQAPVAEAPAQEAAVAEPSAQEAAEETVAEAREESAPEPSGSDREAAAQAQPETEQSSGEAESAQHATEWQQHEGWPGPIPIKPEAHVDESGEGDGTEFDRMVRRQLMKMRAGGKSRAEAERFLERFHFAGDYLGLLDEVYGDNGASDPPRGRRSFWRLRRRAG
jgi:hypothetical protein